MNPDFLKKLAQITAALRGGLVFNPLDELQKRAQQQGEGVGLQMEHDRAQAGYAKAHPESARANREMLANTAIMALQLGKGGERPSLVPAIKTLDGKIVDGITHAHAYMDAGITEPLPPRNEGYADLGANKFYTRQAAEKLMKAWMSPSVKAQVAERSRQAGRDMGITTEDLNGKLYANRGTKATEPITGDEFDKIVEKYRREKGKGAAMDSVTSAAVKIGDKVYSGHGHWDAIQNALDEGKLPGFYEPGFDASQIKEGYVTKDKPFVSREAAARIAKQNGTAKDFNGRLPKLARTTEGISGLQKATPGSRLLEKLTKNGGFTIDPATRTDLTSGYSVGGGEKAGILLKKPLADLKPQELQDFLDTNTSKLQPGQAWGGWVDNGHVYIEPADQVADVNEAQRIGNERGEKAIWDHANKAEIPLKAQKAEQKANAQADFNSIVDKWRNVWTDYTKTGKEVRDFPDERRSMLSTALRQHDIERPNGARPDKIARVEDMANEAFRSPQFRKWLEAGQGTGNWYDTRKTQAQAIDALGAHLGPKAFNELIDHMAASTAMSRPENNLRRASWWRALNLQGMLNPDELRSSTLAAPEGMGHIAQRAHHFAVADLVQNGKLNTLGNPKPASFAENLKMNWRPVTFDTRMSNALLSTEPKASLGLAGVKSDATPRKWAYAPIERAAQSAAAEAAQRGDLGDLPPGADPTAAWQAQVWGGIGRADKTRMMSVNNPSFHEILDRLLKRSATLWNVTPGKANELFWKGQPLDLPLDAGLLNGPARLRKK